MFFSVNGRAVGPLVFVFWLCNPGLQPGLGKPMALWAVTVFWAVMVSGLRPRLGCTNEPLGQNVFLGQRPNVCLARAEGLGTRFVNNLKDQRSGRLC